MAGQTISDRLLAAKHSIAGQGLAKSVCKATTEELLAPKKKHLDYLIHCTNEPNVSIPQLANLLIERSQNTNWVVVFKSLITVHHLLCYGNERFTQYLASSNSSFQLSSYLDKSGPPHAGVRLGYEMSPFIRRYARYLNEKALSYRTVAFDFCKVKRGKEDGVLRTMNTDKLLKTIPVLQSQLDALIEFECNAADLSNSVINMAFMLLFRDLIRLFAGYNDSIINLLEKYFDMNKKQCREALDLYKRFLIRMDKVAEFLKVAENVGIDKGEIPDLTKAPSSLLEALEQHLAALEGKKAISTPTQAATTQQRTDVKTGVNALSSTSSAFGTAAAQQQSEVVDETVAKQIVAEEEAILNQYKAKVQSPVNTGGSSAALSATNPFLTSPTQPIVDLFSAPVQPITASNTAVNQNMKASDDLLQLGNPFSDVFPPMQQIGASLPNNAQNGVAGGTAWMTNGFSNHHNNGTFANAFIDDNSFSSVFGDTTNHATGVSASTAAVTSGTAEPSVSFSNTSVPNPFGTPAGGSLSEAVVSNRNLLESNEFFGPADTAVENKIETSAAAESSKLENKSKPAVPPPRPPPPSAARGMTAMEDLNDSIRVALGSPSRSSISSDVSQLQTSQMQQQQLPQMQPAQSYAIPSQIPNIMQTIPNTGTGPTPPPSQQLIFGSPAKFPTMAVPGAVGMGTQPSVMTQNAMSTASTTTNKVLTGDLDSSLASLAENLTINKTTQPKQMQWNSPKSTGKMGNQTSMWTPQPMAATTGVNYRPMGVPPTNMPTTFPAGYPQMGMPNIAAGARMPQVQGAGMAPGVVMMNCAITQPQPNAVTMAPATAAIPSQGTQLDPFGAF